MRLPEVHSALLRWGVAMVVLTPGSGVAGGYALEHHSARGTARANAVTASVHDGSAIAYNPAGLAMTEGWNVYLGVQAQERHVTFEPRGGGRFETNRPLTVLPNAYLSGRPLDWLVVGVGLHTPFGSRVTWDRGTPGANAARELHLQTYYVSLVLSADLADLVSDLTFGAGVDLVPATFDLTRDILLGQAIGTSAYSAMAFGVGGRAGLMYHPSWLPGLKLGLTYQSPVVLGFSGTGTFDIEPPFGPQLPPDGEITTSLTLPQSVQLGAAMRLGAAELEIGVTYTNWRAFEALRIVNPDASEDVAPRAWRDTVSFRVGGEFNLYEMDLDIRGGYFFDPSPVPAKTLDPSFAEADRHGVSVGGTYYLPWDFYIDAALVYVIPFTARTKPRPPTPEVKGTYEVSSLVVSFNVGWTWGGDPRPEPVSALPVRLNTTGGP